MHQPEGWRGEIMGTEIFLSAGAGCGAVTFCCRAGCWNEHGSQAAASIKADSLVDPCSSPGLPAHSKGFWFETLQGVHPCTQPVPACLILVAADKREESSLWFFSPLCAALQVVFHPINPTRSLIEVVVCININQSLGNMEGQGQAKWKRVFGTYSDLFLLSSPVAEDAQTVFAWCFVESYW